RRGQFNFLRDLLAGDAVDVEGEVARRTPLRPAWKLENRADREARSVLARFGQDVELRTRDWRAPECLREIATHERVVLIDASEDRIGRRKHRIPNATSQT